MAVAEGERSQSKLEVIVRALDLATYTIRITNNQKIFLPEYRSSLTDDIIRTAKDIYIDAWTANNILVKSADDWKMRKALQERAARNCNNLLALIQLAKTIFHLKSKVDECFNGWKDHAAKGTSYQLLRRMEAYYKELWRNQDGISTDQNKRL